MDPTLSELRDRDIEEADRAELARMEAATDARAWKDAVMHAQSAQYWREEKAALIRGDSWVRRPYTAGRCETHARYHERRVREIAKQSEDILTRRALSEGRT